nr:hypothetical protein JVH1_8455 [Rhodococcus sp. JVH1]
MRESASTLVGAGREPWWDGPVAHSNLVATFNSIRSASVMDLTSSFRVPAIY